MSCPWSFGWGVERWALKLQQQCLQNIQPSFPGFAICSLVVTFEQGLWLQTVTDIYETRKLFSQHGFAGKRITKFLNLLWFLSHVMKRSKNLFLGQNSEFREYMPVKEVRSKNSENMWYPFVHIGLYSTYDIFGSLATVIGCELRLKTLCPYFPICRSLIQAPARRVLFQQLIYSSWIDLSINIYT